MSLRGNYKLFYVIELLTGLLLIILLNKFGDYGMFGLAVFFIGLILTLKPNPDEREIFLFYKINSYEGIVIGASMAIIYFIFPGINWFYALLYISLIARGLIGLLVLNYN